MRNPARGRPPPIDAEALADDSFEAFEEEGAPTAASVGDHSLERALHSAEIACKRLTEALRLSIAGTRDHSALIETTGFTKKGGPLTKRISLSEDGELLSDGSACVMSAGIAWRATFDSLLEFADVINDLRSSEAIALGALCAG